MRRATLPEKLALAVPLLAASCASDHHVSPWGAAGSPSLGAFVQRGDLAAQVASIDAETAALGLSLAREIRIELPRGGGAALLRGYEGQDALHRRTTAVRVATTRGVVMALGPLDPRDPVRDQATELVPALVLGDPSPGGGAAPEALRSGGDLNGDGAPDVVLRAETGRLEIWQLGSLGATRYDVRIEAPPTRALDLEGDGRPALVGEVAREPGDPIAPRFTDLATFDGARYSDASPAARAWHARLAEPPRAAPAGDDARLRAALERAWHAILAGKPKDGVQKELGREPVPPALRASFDGHARRISDLQSGQSDTEPRPRGSGPEPRP